MTYEEFMETLTTSLPEYLPEELSKRLTRREIVTTNRTRNILTLEGEPGKTSAAPVIYLDDVYTLYTENSTGFTEVCKNVAVTLMDAMQRVPQIDSLEKQISVDRVFMALINLEENQEFLKSVPHRVFGDLAVIYKIIVTDGRMGQGTVTISNPVMETQLGVSEKQLFEAAMNNMSDLYIVQRIEDTLGFLNPEDTVEPKTFADLTGLPKESIIYVLSNRDMIFGSGILLMKEKIRILAEYLEHDLVLLPSSVHEILAVPDKGDAELMKTCISMVKDVNETSVDPKERLSNSIYRYDLEQDTVKIYTQTGETREISVIAVNSAAAEKNA